MKILAILALATLGLHAEAKAPRIIGVTICPHDPASDWNALRANPSRALKELKTTFDGLRIMDDLGLPGPQSTGLGPNAKETLALTQFALDLGFKEVLLALDTRFAGAYAGSEHYYSTKLLAQQYVLWVNEVKKMRGAERVRFMNNDSGLVSVLTSLPTKVQALDPAWERRNVPPLTWVRDRRPVAKYLKEILQAIWLANPKQGFIVQDFDAPLQVYSPLLEHWNNVYLPKMMYDYKGKLSWPLTHSKKQQIGKQLRVPAERSRWEDFADFDYNDKGMLDYLKKYAPPMEGAAESGLPPETPWPTYAAWLRSVIRAHILLDRSWYFFHSEMLRSPGTSTHYDPAKLAVIQDAVRKARAEAGKR